MCELYNFKKELYNCNENNITYISLPAFCLNLKKNNNEYARTGYWNEKKEKLKQKYAIITDDDLQFCDGKETEMMEMLGYKLGKTKEELRNIIASLE